MTESEKLKSRHQDLVHLSRHLKKKFVGLDQVIDQICSKMASWYLFPEKQSMPLVINLWGMTGTGKTDMVRQIVKFLRLESRFMFYDFAQNSLNYAWESDLREQIEANAGEPFVFCFDELQHLRSIKQSGDESRNPNYLWTLLDRGLIELRVDHHAYSTVYRLHNELDQLRYREEVQVENGQITSGFEVYEKINIRNPLFHRHNHNKAVPFVPHNYFEEICDLMHEDISPLQLEERLLLLNKEESLIFLQKVVKEGIQPQIIPCNNALIFIAGNIDEAYPMAQDLDQDADADEFHQKSQKISVSDIKNALRKRFRAEQIARLGHNHVIYPAFKRQDYEALIDRKLEEIRESVWEHWRIELKVSPKVNQLVYQEGVYPSQGTRPLWSCIQALVEGPVKDAIVHYLIKEQKLKRLKVDFEESSLRLKFEGGTEKENYSFYYFKPSLDVLPRKRKRSFDDSEGVLAVHESGHALAGILYWGISAKRMSILTGGSSRAFTQIPRNREFHNRQIISEEIKVNLAGMAAEKIIFGSDLITSGASDDLLKATDLALNFLKRCGLGSGLGNFIKEPMSSQQSFEDLNQSIELEAQQWLKRCFEEVSQDLSEYKEELIHLARVLFDKGELNKQEIEKYCAFDWSALKGCKGKSDDYLGRFLEVSGDGCLVSLGPMAFEGEA